MALGLRGRLTTPLIKFRLTGRDRRETFPPFFPEPAGLIDDLDGEGLTAVDETFDVESASGGDGFFSKEEFDPIAEAGLAVEIDGDFAHLMAGGILLVYAVHCPDDVLDIVRMSVEVGV